MDSDSSLHFSEHGLINEILDDIIVDMPTNMNNYKYCYCKYDMLVHGYMRTQITEKYGIYIIVDIIQIIYIYYPQTMDVFVRFRPFNQRGVQETIQDQSAWVDYETEQCPFHVDGTHLSSFAAYHTIRRTRNGTITWGNEQERNKRKPLYLDNIFIWVDQQTMFNNAGVPMVRSAMNGVNSTLIAYGQTGSGKKYSMWGCETAPQSGIIYQSVKLLFELLSSDQNIEQYSINVSYIAVYIHNQIKDLLHPSSKGDPPLRVRDGRNGVFIQHLKYSPASDYDAFVSLITTADKNEVQSLTRRSSPPTRLHRIIIVNVEYKKRNNVRFKSRLMFVILSGSERVRKTGSYGRTLREAQAIGQSFNILGNVMSGLAKMSSITNPKKKQCIPFRDSVLTHILKDSLIGKKCKTMMLCTVSPHKSDMNETISTIRFAKRCSQINK
eukprot:915688_1